MYSKLKEMRYKKGYTAKEVAELVGISKAFYCQLENRKRRLSYETAVKISSVFGVKPDFIFYCETLENIKENNWILLFSFFKLFLIF